MSRLIARSARGELLRPSSTVREAKVLITNAKAPRDEVVALHYAVLMWVRRRR